MNQESLVLRNEADRLLDELFLSRMELHRVSEQAQDLLLEAKENPLRARWIVPLVRELIAQAEALQIAMGALRREATHCIEQAQALDAGRADSPK